MILLTGGGWCLLPEGSAPGEGVSAPGGGCLLLGGGLVWPGGSGPEGSGLGGMSARGAVCSREGGFSGGGTHPTGMHSCF